MCADGVKRNRIDGFLPILNQLIRPDLLKVVRSLISVPDGLTHTPGDVINRAQMSFLIHVILFCDLLDRVPTARSYAKAKLRLGEEITLDHGALRTIGDIENGPIPTGREIVSRFLITVGYEEAQTYPLEQLGMTGYAYRHQDDPEDVPQFFVSEIHVSRFDAPVQRAAEELFHNSLDPLTKSDASYLKSVNFGSGLKACEIIKVLKCLVPCFARHNPLPTWETYQMLKVASPEMAWISTEGQVFNHATSRVSDLNAEMNLVRELNLPAKEKIEISESRRVRQSALLASPVTYVFESGDNYRSQEVPGSFFEFIARDYLPLEDEMGARIDLSFDSSNAQGIFKVTT